MTTRQLVIFGAGAIAELAFLYFKKHTDYQIRAFTVDIEFLKEPEFCSLPVVPFETITGQFPPDQFDVFIALSYANINAARKEKYLQCKALGYRLASYISPLAHILTDEPIGENAFILEGNVVQPRVKIGDNVVLWSGNHIGHHSTIHSHTFIASHAVISGGVQIGEQCFIGVNATLRDHIKVGERCVIGAGALLLKDADPDGVYISTATDRSCVPSSRLRGI